uniref:Sec-independent protein translocase component tatA/E n=1 Tax=Ophirina amphinema TaxID=2108040 RepID=A0A348AYU4_9EUKA|nr:Sec-independent protein translocase component tatA/E [Ophirina amphinema]
MTVSIGQLIVLAICLIILFGNIPKLFKDIGKGIQDFKSTVGGDKREVPSDSNKD